MLYHLRVKNLALIDSAEVEFGDGLNILTGETGAGKSIIIGAVQIALGGKAPKEMIRRGCDSAYIELVFSIDDERKREQLKEHDVYPDEEGILIISKKITPTRSISRINDETVTAARLREITAVLLEIPSNNPWSVFGQTDARKVRSCMTLFRQAAPDDDLFTRVLYKFYRGVEDKRTLEQLHIF